MSVDTGRTWRAASLPACRLAASLSFPSPTVGFAFAYVSPTRDAIYETANGASSWKRRGMIAHGSSSNSIAFATPSDGWAVRFSAGALGASERGTLYRTTDGGRTWAPSDPCRGTSVQGTLTTCQTPSFFGAADGVMAAVATKAATHTGRLLVYTTDDAGHTWSAHAVAAGQPLKPYGRTWTRLPEPRLPAYAELDFASADYGWIEAGGCFDYTTDGGRHWKPIRS